MIPSRACVLLACLGILAAALGGCASSRPQSHRAGASRPATVAAARAPSGAVSITVSSSPTGERLGPHYLGLAFEAWTLYENQFAHTNLRAYLQLLGSGGLIRIAGDSIDTSYWTSSGGTAPGWATGTITPADLRSLKRVIAGTGWRVLLGVNLAHPDPARAADEAIWAHRILGSQLAAMGIGNEPNRYGISEAAAFQRFEADVEAIHGVAPEVRIAGPETGRLRNDWSADFARRDQGRHDLAYFTTHVYPTNACGGLKPTIAELLGARSRRFEREDAAATVAGAGRDGAEPVIDETNSAVCWGARGVSDTEASALWISDYALATATQGVANLDIQGRLRGCTPYLPLCTTAGSSVLHVRPEFSGLLAVRAMGTGPFLRTADSASPRIRVAAVRHGQRGLSVYLENPGAGVSVTLRLPTRTAPGLAATVLRTSSPRGLAATSGVTFGGAAVSPAADVSPLRTTPVPRRGDVATVHLAAHSATVLTAK